jgi:hypothetical protein
MGSIRKYRQKEKVVDQYNWLEIDDEVISFIVSLSLHTVILLVASFICFVPPPIPGLVLSLNFSNQSEDTSIEEVNIVEWVAEETAEVADEASYVVSTEPANIDTEITEPAEKVIEVTSIENIENIEKLDLSVAMSPTSVETTTSKSNDSSVSVVDSLRQSISGAISSNQEMVASAGSGSESGIGDRLQSYGAKTGDVQISIAWNTTDDIDLHVVFTPGNGLTDTINWTNPIGRISKGMLDIDMNANGAFVSRTPVENIFWPKNSSPKGYFRVSVHFFRSWSNQKRVPVVVRIQSNGKVQEYKIVAVLYMSPQHVVDFNF